MPLVTRHPVPPLRRSSLALLAALCLLVCETAAPAQSTLAPPPAAYSQKELVALPNTPIAPSPLGTNQVDIANQGIIDNPAGESFMGVSVREQGPLDWGPVHLHPHLLYRFSYGNGLQASPGQPKNTLVNELSPGILLDLNSHWKLDYTPTLRFYSSSAFRDGTDHSVSLNGGTTYQDWVFGLSQSYSSSSAPLIETGSQTDQENFSTAINAGYQFNSKMSLDLAINQNFRFIGDDASTNQLSDSRSWSATGGLNYRLTPKVLVGISATAGYDDLQVGSDMTSEQLQARINWRPGEKLTFAFSGGFEDRQFLNSTQPDSITPIFSLSLVYRLFDPTTISLTASRTVTPSYFQDQVTEATSLSFSIQQRLLQKLTLSLTAGYSTSAYQATTTTITSNRHDDHVSMNARLSCPFLKRGTLSIYYDWTDNASNESGYAYTSNQAGLEIGYRY